MDHIPVPYATMLQIIWLTIKIWNVGNVVLKIEVKWSSANKLLNRVEKMLLVEINSRLFVKIMHNNKERKIVI